MENKYVIKTPGRYYQYSGAINDLGTIIEYLGKNILIVISKNGKNRFWKDINNSFRKRKDIYSIKFATDLDDYYDPFIDVVVGIGGGTYIDNAKYISYKINKPCVIVPTVSSSNAACTSMIVPKKYDNRDTMMIRMKRNPDIILVDTYIIKESPDRYKLAGIGDTLSTFYESLSCYRVNGITMSHGNTPKFLIPIINNSINYLLNIENINNIKDYDEFVSTCIYTSGVIAENCGLSLSHAFSLALEENNLAVNMLHGEKVAVGLLLQLFIEHVLRYKDISDFYTVYNYYKMLGIPYNFNSLDSNIINSVESISKSLSENKLLKNLSSNIKYEYLNRYLIMFDNITKE